MAEEETRRTVMPMRKITASEARSKSREYTIDSPQPPWKREETKMAEEESRRTIMPMRQWTKVKNYTNIQSIHFSLSESEGKRKWRRKRADVPLCLCEIDRRWSTVKMTRMSYRFIAASLKVEGNGNGGRRQQTRMASRVTTALKACSRNSECSLDWPGRALYGGKELGPGGPN